MTLPPIGNINPIQMPSIATPGGNAGTGGEFGSILRNAVSGIETLGTNAGAEVQKFLTGESEELHTTVLATQRAEMAFELGLQVRNKVISAYQEVMRMQL